MSPAISECHQRIADSLSEQPLAADWSDWKWQIRHSIRDIDTVERLLGVQFEPEYRRRLERVINTFPISITPYYFSLIDPVDWRNDPVFRQSVPDPRELDIADCDMADPLHEDADSPAPLVTHRYPDRVLVHVSNVCSMYCRHCTRKRKVGDKDHIPQHDELASAIEYIRRTPSVRDVLLSGGDPLMLSDSQLDAILTEIRAIKHVEIVRIGTRMPVVLPQRITPALVEMLKKHHPLWINTHFNHPREFTSSSKQALRRLADAGIPLGNQTVLLAGVNDCPRIMKTLMHKLVVNRTRPYYLYQCDLSEGLSHFRTPVGKGVEIMESLIGHTSGFAVPTYVIDAPGGGGKIPITPQYMISSCTNKVVLRNYEGVITTYREPDSYPAIDCDRDCVRCKLQLNTDDAPEADTVGIAHLLDDANTSISLLPESNERLKRRRDDGESGDLVLADGDNDDA
jgi:lysine 2,3-aminomutase